MQGLCVKTAFGTDPGKNHNIISGIGFSIKNESDDVKIIIPSISHLCHNCSLSCNNRNVTFVFLFFFKLCSPT